MLILQYIVEHMYLYKSKNREGESSVGEDKPRAVFYYA